MRDASEVSKRRTWSEDHHLNQQLLLVSSCRSSPDEDVTKVTVGGAYELFIDQEQTTGILDGLYRLVLVSCLLDSYLCGYSSSRVASSSSVVLTGCSKRIYKLVYT